MLTAHQKDSVQPSCYIRYQALVHDVLTRRPSRASTKWRSSRVASAEASFLYLLWTFRRRPRSSSAEKRSCASALPNKQPIDTIPVDALTLGMEWVLRLAHAAASTDQQSVECFAPSGCTHVNLPFAVPRPARPRDLDPRENRMPLEATVSPFHRTLVLRLLPASLESYFVPLSALLLRNRHKNSTATTFELREELEARVFSLSSAHMRGANRLCLPGVMTVSAHVLSTAAAGAGSSSQSAVQPPSCIASDKANDSCPDTTANHESYGRTASPSSEGNSSSAYGPPASLLDGNQTKPLRLQRGAVFTQTINLRKLSTDFADMVRALEDTWEIGDASRKQVPFKSLVQWSQACTEL